jgi:hypothetical protein
MLIPRTTILDIHKLPTVVAKTENEKLCWRFYRNDDPGFEFKVKYCMLQEI